MFDPYQELANAIIEMAAKDYRDLANKYHRIINRRKKSNTVSTNKNLEYSQRTIHRQLTEIEKFFVSDWFGKLSAANGEKIIELLKKECQL